MRTTLYNEEAYSTFIKQAKEVVAGTRGYLRLTPAAQAIGINRGQLVAVCKALQLSIDIHGKYGYCAYKP